eukprot:Nitzschia sp. Nitz4//scaffold79_size90958//82892//84188//NITZ4_005040-RA/size90958-processed-gene-0.21-mRNA-1//1//CDS//3329558294//6741//frame0
MKQIFLIVLKAILLTSVSFAFIPQPLLIRKRTNHATRLPATSAASSDSPSDEKTRKLVSDYYGKELTNTNDLKTNACCTAGAPPAYIREGLRNIHPEVLDKYYGCGLCLPQYDLTSAHMLDLGSGAGRDVYLASQLVGPKGRVVGVDMTPEQLDVAKKHQAYHAEKFGFDNVDFKLGTLEHLDKLDLPAESFDVIISNCVINLCADKMAVLNHCWKLLKPGGELYFSDVYASRRVPQALREDKVLWGECLSGALYWNDFLTLSRQAGFVDPRLVEDSPISIHNDDVQKLISSMGQDALKFYSATYRLWKVDGLEPSCEDYGQAVIYKGTIPRYPSSWLLDKHHNFETGKVHLVCGNTYKMLYDTRLRSHFDFVGSWDKHHGIFEGCGTQMPFSASKCPSKQSKGASTGACC